jgi:hypothetical protein
MYPVELNLKELQTRTHQKEHYQKEVLKELKSGFLT